MRKLDPAVAERFLDALVNTRHVQDAAKAAGVSKDALYRYRKMDPAFRAAWEEALERSDKLLRQEAMRRVMEGYLQPVFYHGKEIGTIRKYNDSLLLNLLKLEIRRRERREKLDAEKAEQTDELAEILRLIDGKTRRIHDD
jgi:hypothetical protein